MRRSRCRIAIAALTLMLCAQLGLPATHAYAEPAEGAGDAIVLEEDVPLSGEEALAGDGQEGALTLDQATPDPEAADQATPDPEVADAIELGETAVDAPAEPAAIVVQSSDASGTIASGALTVSNLNANKTLAMMLEGNWWDGNRYVYVGVSDQTDGGTIKVTSSDPSKVAVASDYQTIGVSDLDAKYECDLEPKAVGVATITITYTSPTGATSAASFQAICYPRSAANLAAAKASNNKVKISWDAYSGASGYRVYRWMYDNDNDKSTYALAATVKDASTTSAAVVAPWDQYCAYYVLPYVTESGIDYYNDVNDEGFYADSAYYWLEYPTYGKPTIKKAAYNKISLTWKKVAGATGYKVYRCGEDEWGSPDGNYKAIATVKGVNTLTTTVKAPWSTGYCYVVSPYLTTGGKTYDCINDQTNYPQATSFALPKPTVRISSVTKAAAKKLTVTWKAEKGATAYKLYRSTYENTGYKAIVTTDATTTSATVGATPGTIYYFKVVATYGTLGTATSGTFAQQVPVAASGTETTAKAVGISGLGSWYNANYACTYVQGSTTYVAYLNNRTLTVVGYNKNQKQVSKKKVKLDAYDCWGGIYHGPDNNNYVVTGSTNLKESNSKVVIRVTQYSSAWAKGKTATIKGGVSNSFKGIYEPFRASSIALDMQGTSLYLMTGRTMFQTSDGLHHQSNIAFRINTKTMTSKTSNISYCSHSFGQCVRFKDGTLYTADHGDAYPRAMKLTWQEGYATKDAKEVETVNALDIVGSIGDNYTGATLGGMEVSNSTVLLCGTSVPQGYAVKGVTGNDYTYKRNVYLTVTKRTTGKTQVKWLTAYNPKGKTGVEQAHLVKLSDERFGILYMVNSNGKLSLRYMVVDANGKKIFNRTIKGALIHGTATPKYANGRVYWASYDANYKAKYYSIQAL